MRPSLCPHGAYDLIKHMEESQKAEQKSGRGTKGLIEGGNIFSWKKGLIKESLLGRSPDNEDWRWNTPTNQAPSTGTRAGKHQATD